MPYAKGSATGLDINKGYNNNMTWTVYLDVDGVLLDFVAYAVPFFNKKTGVKVPKGYMPKSKNLKELVVKGKPTFSSLVEILPENWPFYLKSYPKASEFTNSLHKNGIRVVLITTIPQSCQVYRIQNLLMNNIYYDEIYFAEKNDQKVEFIKLINQRHLTRNWVFVDDVALTVSMVQSATKQKAKNLISLDIPYNKDIKAVFPNKLTWAKNLNQVYKYVYELVRVR